MLIFRPNTIGEALEEPTSEGNDRVVEVEEVDSNLTSAGDSESEIDGNSDGGEAEATEGTGEVEAEATDGTGEVEAAAGR